jgi:hypothetical protein
MSLDDAFDALLGNAAPADCYFVRDVADIGTKRSAVCPYGAGELRDAREHADNRGGYVTDTAGRVVYVSRKVKQSELRAIRDGLGAHSDADLAIKWIRGHHFGRTKANG